MESNLSGTVDADKKYILNGSERSAHYRDDLLGYPVRTIRSRDYLLVWNQCPDRYYRDPKITNKKSMLKKTEYELFDVKNDPVCKRNLMDEKEYHHVFAELSEALKRELRKQGDPRMTGSNVSDTYPYYGPLNPKLDGFARQGEYNTAAFLKAER